ncbi:MAG TPA: hypothetical protein VME24_05040 [Alphaproteobacteria bacterium]|nr:hypothetical protein [Alphaproteobacteria bacterium]
MNSLNIWDYTQGLTVVLSEAGKYFLLLLLVVLAVRLWRRLSHLSGPNRQKMLLFASVASILAAVVGYFSISNSLGRLYFYYGTRAVNAGNFGSALLLFQTSAKDWKTPDALGREGVCMLWNGMTNQGMALISEAANMRKSQSTFEDYYEGLYFFNQNQWDTAAPLLASASDDVQFRGNAVKLVSVIELEKGNPQKADQLMQPFAAAEVTDYCQAYIMASLDLWKSNRTEAATLAQKYNPSDLPPFWKSRFQKLDAQLQARAP